MRLPKLCVVQPSLRFRFSKADFPSLRIRAIRGEILWGLEPVSPRHPPESAEKPISGCVPPFRVG
jgi:hypothetical protein